MQMTQEINIHRSVGHKHIVGFHGFFEDNDNVYILLELCRRRVRTELVLWNADDFRTQDMIAAFSFQFIRIHFLVILLWLLS